MKPAVSSATRKDRVTQGAETLNLGRDLFSERGCVGCHRYEGFDRETDALSAARQNTTQLEEQILANEKQIREDTEAANQAADDAEAQKLLAHAESLRVTNSLLAARKDQVNLQSKYLMQDQKKVGPNLKDVKLKLRKEWIPVWLKDPQAFRPGNEDAGVLAFRDRRRMAKIRSKLFRLISGRRVLTASLPSRRAVIPARGKELFETRGCLACHSIGEAIALSADTLPPTCKELEKRQTTNTSFAGFIIRANVGRLIVPKRNAI